MPSPYPDPMHSHTRTEPQCPHYTDAVHTLISKVWCWGRQWRGTSQGSKSQPKRSRFHQALFANTAIPAFSHVPVYRGSAPKTHRLSTQQLRLLDQDGRVRLSFT